MLSRSRYSQNGLTVIELLVGMTVGLLVVGMVLSVYLTTLGTSGDTLKASRLNQEIAAIMNIMVNDIRRAGYAFPDGPDWDDPGGADPDDMDNYQEPTTNPFNQIGVTALEVRDAATDTDQGSQGNGDCIVYGYDASMGDGDGVDDDVRDDDEFFGFRYNADTDAIMMRRALDWTGGDVANSCAADAGTWETLNDESNIEITSLDFDLAGSSCINSAEPDGNGNDDDAESDCYNTVPTPGSGHRTVERRDVLITINARLVDDPQVTTTMVQRVAVRNDLVRQY